MDPESIPQKDIHLEFWTPYLGCRAVGDEVLLILGAARV